MINLIFKRQQINSNHQDVYNFYLVNIHIIIYVKLYKYNFYMIKFLYRISAISTFSIFLGKYISTVLKVFIVKI